MSQENVEVVREAWSVYRERGIDAALGYFAEDCIVEDFPELPDRANYGGWQGVRERDRKFTETWGDLDFEPVEFIDAGGGVVVAVTAIRGHGRGSNAPMEAEASWVYELREGRIVRDRPFLSKAEALEAAGLSE